MLNCLLKTGKVSNTKYRKYVRKEQEMLDYIEWYYSDPVQDKIAFLNWKVGYEMYEMVRDILQ